MGNPSATKNSATGTGIRLVGLTWRCDRRRCNLLDQHLGFPNVHFTLRVPSHWKTSRLSQKEQRHPFQTRKTDYDSCFPWLNPKWHVEDSPCFEANPVEFRVPKTLVGVALVQDTSVAERPTVQGTRSLRAVRMRGRVSLLCRSSCSLVSRSTGAIANHCQGNREYPTGLWFGAWEIQVPLRIQPRGPAFV